MPALCPLTDFNYPKGTFDAENCSYIQRLYGVWQFAKINNEQVRDLTTDQMTKAFGAGASLPKEEDYPQFIWRFKYGTSIFRVCTPVDPNDPRGSDILIEISDGFDSLTMADHDRINADTTQFVAQLHADLKTDPIATP